MSDEVLWRLAEYLRDKFGSQILRLPEAESWFPIARAAFDYLSGPDRATVSEQSEERRQPWGAPEIGLTADESSAHWRNVPITAGMWFDAFDRDYPELATAIEVAAKKSLPDTRKCTCYPDDNPPVPCPRKFALTECRAAAPGTLFPDNRTASEHAHITALRAARDWIATQPVSQTYMVLERRNALLAQIEKAFYSGSMSGANKNG